MACSCTTTNSCSRALTFSLRHLSPDNLVFMAGTGASTVVWGSSSPSQGPVMVAYTQLLDKVCLNLPVDDSKLEDNIIVVTQCNDCNLRIKTMLLYDLSTVLTVT